MLGFSSLSPSLSFGQLHTFQIDSSERISVPKHCTSSPPQFKFWFVATLQPNGLFKNKTPHNPLLNNCWFYETYRHIKNCQDETQKMYTVIKHLRIWSHPETWKVFKTLVQSLVKFFFHAWSLSAACLHAHHFGLYITRDSDGRTAAPPMLPLPLRPPTPEHKTHLQK